MIVRTGTAATVFAAAMLTATAAMAQDSLKLVVATGNTTSQAMGMGVEQVIVPKLAEYSEGRIEVEAVYGGGLCTEHTCVEQAQLGQIDIGTISSGNVGAFGTTFGVMTLPYIFADGAASSRLLGGWLQAELQRRAAEEMGLHVLAVVPGGGFRQLTNNVREVQVPGDLEGIKVRVTKSPVTLNLIKSWGGVAVPYDWAELYEGLESGVVEGMYLQIPYTESGKFYEVTSHITLTNGVYSSQLYFMDLNRYNSLPDWAREVVDRVGADLQELGPQIDHDWSAQAMAAMGDSMAIYEPTDAQMSEWRAGAVDAWTAVDGKYDKELARRVLTEQGLSDFIATLEEAGAL